MTTEVLDFLSEAAASGGLLLDGTVGLGGHARAFLERVEDGRVIGLDRDESALTTARTRLEPFGSRVRLVHRAFADLESALDELGEDRVAAVLLDLGVSSLQLDDGDRGFSFRHDAPLDMRMDRTQETTARDLVNRLPERQLADLLWLHGDERASRRVARAIAAERRRAPIETTGELARIVRRVVRQSGRIDAATRTFQALRIAVNGEDKQLEAGLEAATRRLTPGGIFVVLSFHSNEDRVVKNFFRGDERLEVLTKKVVRATAEEARANPRSRPAKLRAARRKADA